MRTYVMNLNLSIYPDQTISTTGALYGSLYHTITSYASLNREPTWVSIQISNRTKLKIECKPLAMSKPGDCKRKNQGIDAVEIK